MARVAFGVLGDLLRGPAQEEHLRTAAQADLGLGSYRTAWLLLHKIRACFDESLDFPLRGLVEVDEAYVGGAEKGIRPGRSASKKGIVVTAVEVLPKGR